MENQAANTDRELYREPDNGNGSFYSDSIHVTASGGIGINCGGYVFVRTLRAWHRLASDNEQLCALVLELNRRLVMAGVDPRAEAEQNLRGSNDGVSRPPRFPECRTAGLIPATGSTFETFCARCGDDITDIDHDYIIGPRAGHYCFGCTPMGEVAHVVRVAK